MLSQRMNEALNEQIKWEFYSGFLYLSMSAYFSGLGLNGFASWMHVQFEEESAHAMKFYDQVIGRGGRVLLETLDAPPSSWGSPLNAFEETLKHEQHVTSRINDLADLAVSEKDHATSIFLQWFITEQVEEEDNVSDVLNKLKLVGGGEGLFFLDKELGTRTFVPPA